MSNHTIHGHTLSIDVLGFAPGSVSRQRCIGKVVNLMREMDKSVIDLAVAGLRADRFGNADSAALLSRLDDALAEGHHKPYATWPDPLAVINLVEA